MKFLIFLIMTLLLVQANISQTIADVDSTYLIKPLHSISNQTDIPFYAVPRPRLEKYVVSFELLPEYELRVYQLTDEIKDVKKWKSFYKDAFFYTLGAILAITIWESVR